MSTIRIAAFIKEPWREVALDAMERGVKTCKLNNIEKPDAYLVMIIGLCDIINEFKAKESK